MANQQKLSAQDIHNMSVQYQQMQYQAEAVSQQINLIGYSIEECNRALNAISELEGIPAEHEILVPIGYGTNVKAKLTKPENVIVEVGAQISVEKKLDDARKTLQTRKEELAKYLQNMQKNLNEIVTRMKDIETVVARASAEKKKPQQQPMQGS